MVAVLPPEIRQRSICFGVRMGCVGFLKQANLANFTGIIKAGLITGKYMPAIVPGHFIQGLAAPLGQNDGFGCYYGGKIIGVRFPPGADYVFFGFKHGVKRYDHKYLAHSSQMKAQSQIIIVVHQFWKKNNKTSDYVNSYN
jgi:hypothetical protein